LTKASLLDEVRAAAAPYGLNLIAAIPADRYDSAVKPAARADAIDREARSIVVLANGGGDFWCAYRAFAEARPGWRARDNPLDDFTREVVERDIAPRVRAASARCTTTYPFVGDAPTLNFVELGRIAGLGGPSIVGVLVNPIYGPWVAFRAALLIDAALDAPGDAAGFDPCPGCIPRSCIAACPTGAVRHPAGWDIVGCLTYRVEREPDCAPGCHARAACVLGPEHRYPDDELAYHQMRALRAMRPYYDEHIKPKRS
jgi:hypothetical protein